MERLIDAVVVFVLIIIFGMIVYKNRKKISFKYSTRFYLQISLIAFIFAYVVSKLNPNNIGNIIIYVFVFFFLPVVYANNKKARYQQQCFDEVILFAQSFCANLKDTKNVVMSLERTKNNNYKILDNDIYLVINSLSESQNECKKVFNEFYKKYNYSIVNQLLMIALAMHYENNEECDDALAVLQNDIDLLRDNIKENQQKRKALRIQYIGLSIGCMLALWLFINQIRSSISEIANNLSNVVLAYYLGILIILFIVDSYFTNHLSKE